MVPKLRFSEFNTPWKQVSLGEVCADAAYGMNSAATAFDGSNKYIRITDIDDESREFSPSPLTSPSGTLDNKYLLRDGDIVFARTGASVGKSYLYKKNDGKLYFAGFLIRLSINKANPCFVYNQTLTRKYRKWVKIYSMRSGQPGINAEEYKEFDFAIPSSEEQNKIANFLSSIDERIALMNKQYKLLCQYKKSMMQKIFSQALRFKDDNGKVFPEWTCKTINDLGEIVGGGTPDTNSLLYWNGEIPWFTPSEIKEKFVSASYRTITPEGLATSSAKLIPAGTVLFTSRATIGDVAIAQYQCSTNQGFQNICVNKNNSNYFVYYLLCSLKNTFIRRAGGSTFPEISKSNFQSTEILVPSLSEQTKIARFLSAVDDKITSKKAELDKLKIWKQGMLQQMFV
ncbi:hypothetical protein SB6411_04261 [Klebsiella spallanzanii]|uniref:Type I restriction modification DNA specificity domain-containing protein n=1 Tax=Klebsiella spallanzanii TaxID=2587528 RepID=A0ABY6V5Y6_9ENTR|nr:MULTISPECIES: restriction endonuclease subunit S [Klebsiella]HAV0429367.1 restriction endonuclease subunit S [Klebsiella oxytoca]HBT2158499.1 restriction endonuclease subunit S [Klebsiella pneumoniae]HEC2577315.1 restriction endonuclease subunit S [Raoultella ornithinolytica]UXO78253.1 restriction endonuclease subunit S [Klebsiella michiganensis]VUS26541.1 hypothetical protein SB6411_04261 [Klebsiella spallanzanii]